MKVTNYMPEEKLTRHGVELVPIDSAMLQQKEKERLARLKQQAREESQLIIQEATFIKKKGSETKKELSRKQKEIRDLIAKK